MVVFVYGTDPTHNYGHDDNHRPGDRQRDERVAVTAAPQATCCRARSISTRWWQRAAVA